jgi:nucleoside-diphosphate-sugar epimerase
VKVLITGGAGYIGSIASADFVASGYDVTVFDKLIYGGEGLLSLGVHSRFKLIQADVRSTEAVRAAMDGVKAVVHLAAVVGEPACSIDETKSREINSAGTQIVFEAAKSMGVERFIYVSTCSNYGVSEPNILTDEDAPLKPLSTYASSKVEGERLALDHTGSMTATVLRFGTICGLSPRMRFDLLVSEMARNAVLGRPLDIFSPAAWRPFLHVRDASRALRTILEAPKDLVSGLVYNVVGENKQKSDLVDMVRKHYPETSVEVTSKLPDLRDYRVSATRIANALQFAPQYSIEDAFLETAQAVKNGVFRDPFWQGHSAIPLDRALLDQDNKTGHA